MANEERLSRREFLDKEERPLLAAGGDIINHYGIDDIISSLNELIDKGYTDVKLDSEYSGWVELSAYKYVYETDEEMNARINQERTEWELTDLEKETKKNIMERLMYEKLKLKFEGK